MFFLSRKFFAGKKNIVDCIPDMEQLLQCFDLPMSSPSETMKAETESLAALSDRLENDIKEEYKEYKNHLEPIFNEWMTEKQRLLQEIEAGRINQDELKEPNEEELTQLVVYFNQYLNPIPPTLRDLRDVALSKDCYWAWQKNTAFTYSYEIYLNRA